MSRRPVPGIAKELTHFARLASSAAESQATRTDALNQLQALLRLPSFSRQHDSRQALGQAWCLIAPLVLSPSPRVAGCAATCLAALGGTIFAAGGAFAPAPQPVTDAGRASGLTAARRGGRGGRKGTGRGRSGPVECTPTAVEAPAGAAQRRPTQLPATVLVSWAVRLLEGGDCSECGAIADTPERRAHVLAALRQCVELAPADVRSRLALRVLSAARRLVDAGGQAAAELGSYLGVMLAAVDAAEPADVAGSLTDMLDSFLGWALTASCKPEDRALMHKIVHKSGDAWHHAAQPVCDLIATVTGELEGLSRDVACGAAFAAQPAANELPIVQRFLALATLPATVATVMLHHPSPRVVVSAELGRRQLCALLSFCDSMVSSSIAASPATADAALRTCLQLASAWLALLHRVTATQALVQVLEAPCVSPHAVRLLPAAAVEQWGVAAHPPPASAGTAVQRLVRSAFASAVAAAGSAELQFQEQQPSESAHNQSASASMAAATSLQPPPRLPLWLLMVTVLSAALQVSLVPAPPTGGRAAGTDPVPALREPSTRLQSNAWALLSVLSPLLQAIAAEPAQRSRSSHAADEAWAGSCWRTLLERVPAMLSVPSAGNNELSRAVASCLLSVITAAGGEPAIRHVCGQLEDLGLQLSSRSGGSADGQASGEAISFRFLFCIHLLQTALRKQSAAPSCVRAAALCLADVLRAGPAQQSPEPRGVNGHAAHLCGLSAHLALCEAMPLMAAAAMAVQRAAAGRSLQQDADMASAAMATCAHACRLLLHVVVHLDPGRAEAVDGKLSGDPGTILEQARSAAAHVQHMAATIGSGCGAATLLHCADLLYLFALRRAATADHMVCFDLNPALSGPLPGDKAAGSEAVSAAASPLSEQLLLLARELLATAASPRMLSRWPAAAAIAPACLTGVCVRGKHAAACKDLFLALPARSPAAGEGTDLGTLFDESELRKSEAAAAAVVEAQLTAALQGAQRTQLRANAAIVLLKDVLQVNGAAEAKPAKVLVGGGKAPAPEAESPWTLAVKAISARYEGCCTSAAAIHETLHAMAAALVDAKLKAANSNTGETLVMLESFLRKALREDPALATTAPAADHPGSGPVVACPLLPSWPRLHAESTAAAVARLLFALEQRLVLARSGGLMATEASPQKAASLYFFVNGAETDKWFLRVCEPRTLVATSAALPHVALHAAFVWLKQLLAALQHFDVPPGRGNSGQQRPVGSPVKGTAPSQAPKLIKVLQAPAGHTVSTPRSVVKVPYSRTARARTGPEGSSDAAKSDPMPTPAPSQPAVQVQEAPNPRKMPKRLIASMVQLLAAMCSSLVATRGSAMLWRLYRACTSAATPALQHIMAAGEGAGAEVPGSSQPSARAAAESLLSFVLAAMHQVEGQYESAAALYRTAAQAAAQFPGLPGGHVALCSSNAASCYAALADWTAVSGAAASAAPRLSAGVRVHCADLQSLRVWSLPSTPDAAPEVPLVPRPSAAPVLMSAAIDGALARAQQLLGDLFPQATPAAVAQVPATVRQLDAEFSAAFAALQATHHTATPVMAAELLACTHAAAASSQALAARLPPGQPPPVPPGWLSSACAAMDPCQHLLAASELLTCGHGAEHALIAQSALTLQLTPLSRGMHARDARCAPSAAQLPVHMHVFSIASALASAREYGVAAPAASGRKLPGKEAVLQALLTVGERGISAALQGGNTGAAKRLVTGLMQSDVVVPLLVAGQSVHTSAHVQEGLLRLQLQKLRYQLALHSSGAAPAQPAQRSHVPTQGSSQALNELLPDDLLEDQRAWHAAAPPPQRPLAALATMSKGMQPLSLASASEELWSSLQPCLQPGAPLLGTPGGSSGASALASCVQQLAVWSAVAGAEMQPAWLPSLRAALRDEGMLARLSRQMQGGDGAGWRGLLSGDVATSAPAMTALATAAVSSGEELRSAWLSFGDWLYAHARRTRHTRSDNTVDGVARQATKAPLTDTDALCYGRVALAYARALALGSGATTDTTRLLLRLLHFAIHHNKPAMQPALGAALRLVPPATWQVLAPQLFVQLQHSKQHVRTCATELLAALARVVPAAVLYTLVANTAADQTTAGPQQASAALLAAVTAHDPERVAACRTLLHGLRQLTPVAAESWQISLEGALSEIRRRLVTLKTEAARIFNGVAAADEQLTAAWQRRYTTMLAHGVGRLNFLLQEWDGREARSAHEAAIIADFVPALKGAVAAFDAAPTGGEACSELDAQLQPLEALVRKVAEPARGPDLELSHFAPVLCNTSPTGGLPVPGTGQDDTTIVGFLPKARLLPSKTRPKRIDIVVSNGRTVRFLLKGGDDLQQEQRMQQLLACIDSCVRAHGRPGSTFATRRRAGQARNGSTSGGGAPTNGRPAPQSAELQTLVLNVTPLGPGMGLVQWVPRSVTLFDVFKSWQARMAQRHQAAAAAGRKSSDPVPTTSSQASEEPAQRPPGGDKAGRGGRGRGRGGKALPSEITESHRLAMQAATAALGGEGAAAKPPAPPAMPPSPSVPGIIGLKPAQLFYSVLQQALQASGHSAQLSRRQWPADVLLAAFRALVRQAPAQLLANELSTSANDAEHWWAMHNRYAGSLASTSMASYLLGIGDRHLNNMLVVQGTGQVVHIDSAVSLDQGATLRVPEVVPFRLTQMLVAALGPLGAQGTFTTHACTTLAAVRAGSSALTSLVDTIVLDPSVDWVAAKRAAAAARGLDSAMALRLWLTHLEETLPGQFAHFQDLLQSELHGALRLADLLHTAGEREQRASAAADRVASLKDTLDRGAAKHRELTQAMQAAHAACLPHKGTLTKHIGFLKDVQPRLEAERQVIAAMWGRLQPESDQALPGVVVAHPSAWSPEHAPGPLMLFMPQPELEPGLHPSLRAALAAQHPLAFHSALHTLPPSTLAACETTDALFAQAWQAHTAARQQLASSLAAYLRNVPRRAGIDYVDTTSHAAWCHVLRGLEAVVSSSALDERGIVAALQHMPLADTNVATGAMQSVLRSLGAFARARNVVDEAAEAAGFVRKPPPLAGVAPAQLLAAAASQRGALQQGLVQGLAATATTLERAAGALRSHEEIRRQAETGRSQDAWGAAVDTSGRDSKPDAVAEGFFREGGCASLLRDVAGCLQGLAADKAASAALGSAQSQSLLLAVTTRSDTLQAAAREVDSLAHAAERAAAVQSFLAHALCPMLRPAAHQPSAAVQLLAAAYSRAVQPLRSALVRLEAALRRAAKPAPIRYGLQPEDATARAAESDTVVASAAQDVQQAAERAQAQVATAIALDGAVTAVAAERYVDAAMRPAAGGLCVDTIAGAAASRHGDLAAARAILPMLHALHEEVRAVADAGLSGAQSAALRIPAHWRAHTADEQRSEATTPAHAAWGATIWGGPSSAASAGGLNIWGSGLPGAAVAAAGAHELSWPLQLIGNWAQCAALFALDTVLQAAVAAEQSSQSALCRRLASHPQGAMLDSAERCMADMFACGPAVVAAARMRLINEELLAPPAGVPVPMPALPPASPQAQPPPPPAIAYPPQRPAPGPQPPAAQLQSLGRVPAHAVDAAQPDGRQLESFQFFDCDVGGADIMLGGLSQASSLEAQSIGEPAHEASEAGSIGMQQARFGFQDDELPGTAVPLQGDDKEESGSDADEMSPQPEPQGEHWLPNDIRLGSRSGSEAQSGHAPDSVGAAHVAQLFTSLVTRQVPALCAPSRSASAVSDSPAAGASAHDALPPLPRSCLECLSALTAARYGELAQEARSAAWLLSHLLPADLAPLVATTTRKGLVKGVLESLTSPNAPAGARVHALVTNLQHAAANMYDARQALAQWRASYDEASSALLRHLSSCGSGLSGSAKEGVQAAQQWVSGVVASTATLLDDLAAGVLSLEASRAGQGWGPGAAQDSLLQTLPQVVRDMSAAAVKAAAAQAHLNGVRGESQALELAVQTARASLPDEDAAAATADAAAAQAAAAVATEASALRNGVSGLACELPTLVDTMHADLRQSMRDLGLLPKTHVADVAKLCNQISRSWQHKKPGFALLAQSAHELLAAAAPLAPPPHGSAKAKQHVKAMRAHLRACAAPAAALLDASRDLYSQVASASLNTALSREPSQREYEGGATMSVVGGALGLHADELSRLQQHGAAREHSQSGAPSVALGLEELAGGVGAAARELHEVLSSIRNTATDVTTALHDHALKTRQPQGSGTTYAQKMDKNRIAFAKGVMQRTTAKVHGVAASGRALPVEEHVQVLIAQATSSQRLSRMYEGWTAWL